MNNQQPINQEPQLNTPPQQPDQLQPAQTFLKRWMPTIAGIAIVVLVGGGVLAYQTWRSEPSEPTTEELQEQQEGTAPTEFPDAGEKVGEETADLSSDGVLQDWKMYRSEDFGFELKYPSTWTIEYVTDYYDEGDVMLFKTYRSDIEKVPFLAVKQNWSVQKELDKINSQDPPYTKVNSVKEDSLGSVSVSRISYSTTIGLPFEKIVIANGTTMFMFDLLLNDKDFETVISTFKFID